MWVGDEYFTSEVNLPDYDVERFYLVLKSILIVLLFVFILPIVLAKKKKKNNNNDNNNNATVDEKNISLSKTLTKNPTTTTTRTRTTTTTTIVRKRVIKKRIKKNGRKEEIVSVVEQQEQPQKKNGEQKQTTTNDKNDDKTREDDDKEAPLLLLNLMCIVSLVILIGSSSNNYLTARTAYMAPLLTQEECDYIIDASHRAAKINADESESSSMLDEDSTIQRNPKGWHKARHSNYPTTDLNIVVDPYTTEDRQFLSNIFHSRLSTLIERIYGINRSSLRANDMFVVRYDAADGQPYLQEHTDSAHVSFNILLNDNFVGGGTRFHNRAAASSSFNDARPPVGYVLINNANILHEGLITTNGTRYILVGFTSVDRFDPLTKEYTGLSLFASLLSLPWMQVMAKKGVEAAPSSSSSSTGGGNRNSNGPQGSSLKWSNNKYINALFWDIYVAFTILEDLICPHDIIKMVSTENATKYIQALDHDYYSNEDKNTYTNDKSSKETERKRRQHNRRNKSKWFSGQQLFTNFDGTIIDEWDTRQKKKNAFKEL